MAYHVDPRALKSVSTDFSVSFNDISGSGGMMGGSSKGSSSTKSDANNTLRSNAKAKIVEVLGEGEIVGLVDGAKSIFFDATALQNSDGSYNFKGVTWQQRHGTPDQEMLTGIAQSETPFSVGIEVKSAQTPPIRTIADRNATSVRVIVNIPSLVIQDPKTGSLLPTDLDYVISRRAAGGQWEEVRRELFLQQKTTSPYQKASVIELPDGGHPYSISVRKVNPDSNVEYHQNSMVWESYSVLTEGKFIYPNTAMVAMDLDASNFGSSIPARYYDVKGLIIQVPSNYDPETRAYSGFWDGSFKRAWSNNPAWVFYDLLTHNRYGLGEFIDDSKIDKFGLYEIAQWCDTLVDDGFGGKEPRYTYNGVINSRDEAFKVLQQITTSFRGQAYWSVGQVFAVADMPGDFEKILSPANVIGGAFKYSRTAKKTRNTVAMVSWNDPEDFYRNAIEVVQHDEGLDRFGWRQTDIQAIGCTSRGLANRIGRWTLDTEHTATESVEFEMGLDALAKDPLKPGKIIAIADPRKAQTRIGGRIAASTSASLTLDKAFEPLTGSTYRISVVDVEGEIQTREIIGWTKGNTEALLATSLSRSILPSAMWAITGTDVAPRQYRVLSVTEPKKNTFKVTALTHDPQKYARVEEGIVLDPIRYTRPRTKIAPVTNLKTVERQFIRDGLPRTEILLSWSPANDWLSSSYTVYLVGPDGDVDMGTTTAMSMTLGDLAIGDWTAYVTAVGVGDARSEPASAEFSVKGWAGLSGPEIVNLRVRGGGKEFTGQSCSLEWDVAWPDGQTPYEIDFVVRVFEPETQQLLSDWVSPGAAFTYTYEENISDGGPRRKFVVQVRPRNLLGNEGAPGTIVVSNNPPDFIVPDITTTTESIFIGYEKPLDPDFQGVLVWQSKTSGYDPLKTAPVYEGQNTLVNLPAEKEVFYYLRIAGYDAFSKTGLNISPEYRVFVTNKIIDTDAPEIPTGLKLTTKSETNAAGVTTAMIAAVWDPNPSKNFGRFGIEIREGLYDPTKPDALDGWLPYPIDATNTYEWHNLKPGATYAVRLRAWNSGGFAVSGFSQVVTIVAGLNLVPPGPATNLVATAAFETASLSWTNPPELDFAHCEIWMGTTKDQKLSTRVATVAAPAAFYVDVTLPTNGTRYYWVRPVNSSGVTALTFTGPGEAISAAIKLDQIAQGAIDATKFVSGIEPIVVVAKLPVVAGYTGPKTVLLETDGKLYRLTANGWTASVASSDIAGLVQSAQIAALDAQKVTGQITQTQIADNSISTPKLMAGSVQAGNIASYSIQAYNLAANSVTSYQIAAQSITSDKFTANSIGAGIIQAGAISTNQLQAGGINANRLIAKSISATEIGANSIFSEMLVTRMITADKVAIGTLTGDVIAANTITGNHIQANSIAANRITLNGSSTLANWLYGSDTTKIEGGAIAANTISANKLTIGARGLRFVGIEFQVNKNSRTVSWTGGHALMQDDAGNPIGHYVNGGSVGIGAQLAYIYWSKQSPNTLNVGGQDTWPAIIADGYNVVLVATYDSYAGLAVTYGQTIIDGTKIVTGSITANQIAAYAIQAQHIAAGSITAEKIAAGAIYADLIGAGTITAASINLGSDRFQLVASQRRIRIFTPEGWEAVSMGDVSPWITGSENQSRYGIVIRENSNREVMRVSNEGAYINGAYIGTATIGSAAIQDAVITNAKIQNLTVGGEKIANASLTRYWGASASNDAVCYPNFATGQMIWVTIQRSGTAPYAQYATGNLEVYVDGALVYALPAVYQALTNGTNVLHATMAGFMMQSYGGGHTFHGRDSSGLGTGVTIYVTECAK